MRLTITFLYEFSLTVMIPPLLWNSLTSFLMLADLLFSPVQVTFESTNVVVDHIDKLLDTRGSPFSLVHPRPSSICQTHVNAFLGQMVYYYCTTITESFL